MIEIWEPRYRDRSVLLAKYKVKQLRSSNGVEVKIEKGAYKGNWVVPNDVLDESKEEKMKTKNGTEIEMIAVPLERMEKNEISII